MPKVTWSKDEEQERTDNRRKIVLMKLIQRGFKTQKELATAAKIHEMKLSRALNHGMDFETLVKVDKVLNLSNNELADLVRGERR